VAAGVAGAMPRDGDPPPPPLRAMLGAVRCVNRHRQQKLEVVSSRERRPTYL
jgi:hypothetical protein